MTSRRPAKRFVATALFFTLCLVVFSGCQRNRLALNPEGYRVLRNASTAKPDDACELQFRMFFEREFSGTTVPKQLNVQIASDWMCVKKKGSPLGWPGSVELLFASRLGHTIEREESFKYCEGEIEKLPLEECANGTCEELRKCTWNGRYRDAFPLSFQFKALHGSKIGDHARLIEFYRNGSLVVRWDSSVENDDDFVVAGSRLESDGVPHLADFDARLIPADTAESVITELLALPLAERKSLSGEAAKSLRRAGNETLAAFLASSECAKVIDRAIRIASTGAEVPRVATTKEACESLQKAVDRLERVRISKDFPSALREVAALAEPAIKDFINDPATVERLAMGFRDLATAVLDEISGELKDAETQYRLYSAFANALPQADTVFDPLQSNPAAPPGAAVLQSKYSDSTQAYFLAAWSAVPVRIPSGFQGSPAWLVPAIDAVGVRFQFSDSRFSELRLALGAMMTTDFIVETENDPNTPENEETFKVDNVNFGFQGNVSLANFKFGIVVAPEPLISDGSDGIENGVQLLLGADLYKLISGRNAEIANYNE